MKVYKDGGQTTLVSQDGTHRVVVGWGKGYPPIEFPVSTVDNKPMKVEDGQPDPHASELLEDAPEAESASDAG